MSKEYKKNLNKKKTDKTTEQLLETIEELEDEIINLKKQLNQKEKKNPMFNFGYPTITSDIASYYRADSGTSNDQF